MTAQTPCTTLERVAALLPSDDRQRFLLVVARFRNIPQDDEYLQVLEAIGFMTLLWKSVPNEIQGLLEGANPAQDTAASIARLVRDAVSEAIPSQQDLRGIAQTMREHEAALRGLARGTGTKTSSGHSGTAVVLLVLVILALLAERLGFIQLL